MTGFRTKPLEKTTWPDFARLVEKHNGVWGGCWCMSFHLDERGFRNRTVSQNRAEKKRLVRDSRAHAALVYDGLTAVGWCQFGPTDELPRVKNKPAYLNGLIDLERTRSAHARRLNPSAKAAARCPVGRQSGKSLA